MEDGGGLAVHEALGAYDPAPIDLADGLVSETHAEDRDATSELHDHLEADAGVLRGPGAWRNQDAVRASGADLGRRRAIVEADVAVDPESLEVLDEVEGEGVVVVDDDDAPGHGLERCIGHPPGQFARGDPPRMARGSLARRTPPGACFSAGSPISSGEPSRGRGRAWRPL